MNTTLFKNFIYPIIQLKYPPEERSLKILKLLDKTQWWTTQDIQTFQHKRLRLLLEHAYQHVPYYHNIFSTRGLKPQDIKTMNDLRKLPILTKKDIRDHYTDLTTTIYRHTQFIPSQTSGSTGMPLRFFVDKQWLAWNMAVAYREWHWAGYTIGDKIVYLWGVLQGFTNQEPLAKISNSLLRTIKLNSFHMT